MAEHIVPETIELNFLDAEKAFEGLSDSEKKYAYHMYKTSWAGLGLISFQCNYQSYIIFKFFVSSLFNEKLPSEYTMDELWNNKISPKNWRNYLNYWSLFCGHGCSNYNSWGEYKLIPRLLPEDFMAITRYVSNDISDEDITTLTKIVYSLDKVAKLDFYPKGQTGYNHVMTEDEVNEANKLLQKDGILLENTLITNRLMPLYIGLDFDAEKEGIDKKEFYLLVFSQEHKIVDKGRYAIIYGVKSEIMNELIKHLEKAKEFVRSDVQHKMIQHYINHFRSGDLEDHINSQREWIKDKSPNVETNLGFVETYRDPAGVRAEWESLLAVVDQETSKKYQTLVDQAPDVLKDLPWPSEFEKDVFQKPDFTSLQVIAFSGSGIPAGINIPNYDVVRQNEGFKNVSLENVITSSYFSKDDSKPIQFIHESDYELYRKYGKLSFDVEVAGHELLGHGSGKLFYEGKYDISTIDPTTKKPVASHYKKDETYDSVFGQMGSAMEECRAELVGLTLHGHPKMMEIFNISKEEEADVEYIGWLGMMRSAIKGLTMHDGQWRQAHCQARFAILRKAMEVDGLIEIITEPEVVVKVNRDKIPEGKKAIADLLVHIHVFRSLADYPRAKEIFDRYTTLNDKEIKIRDQVKKEAKPRGVFIQGSLKLEDGDVKYVKYPLTPEGMIESMIDKLR